MALVAVSLAASPLIITFLQGAFSLLACVAVVEAYLALRRSHDGRAGAWLVLATIKPQAVAGLGVMLLVGRRWRAIGVGLVVAAGLGLLATVVLGPAIWGDYLRFLSRYVSTFDELSVRPSVMWNVRGTLTLLIGPDRAAEQAGLINGLAFVGQILGLLGVAWLWRGRWSPTTPDFDLRFALTIVIGLLTSAHLNPHDDLLLVPAAAIAYRALRERPEGGRDGLLLAVATFVVLIANGISANAVEGPPIRVPVVVMALFAIGLAWRLRGESRRPRRDGRRPPGRRDRLGDGLAGRLPAGERETRRADREAADPQDRERERRRQRDRPATVGQGAPHDDDDRERQAQPERHRDLELRRPTRLRASPRGTRSTRTTAGGRCASETATIAAVTPRAIASERHSRRAANQTRPSPGVTLVSSTKAQVHG